jgi:formate/nitrite transporter FocA (FNT family)
MSDEYYYGFFKGLFCGLLMGVAIYLFITAASV